jgi:hypothetical protein
MMGWRDRYEVHPAADVFPMMSDEELAALGKDIDNRHGLKEPITFDSDGLLLDGRNRLEAMERKGLLLRPGDTCSLLRGEDAVAYIISKNIFRRHLTKQQQADLIVDARMAAAKPRQNEEVSKKPRQDEEVSKGGRGKVDPIKRAALNDAEKQGISKSTIERSLRKKRGKPKADSLKPKPQEEKPKPQEERKLEVALADLAETKQRMADLEDAVAKGSIDAARARYVLAYTKLDSWGRKEEMTILANALRKAVANAA